MTSRTATGVQPYRQELTASPAVFGPTRKAVSVYLRELGLGELVGPATLCVTEMLSNVHEHVHSDACVLALQVTLSGLRIVVSDRSSALPVIREPDVLLECGRGVQLLNATADAWGAQLTDDGKDVWVEFHSVEAT